MFVSIVLVLCFLVGCTQSLTSNVELDKATEIYPEGVKKATVKASSTKTATSTSTLTPTETLTPTSTSTPTVGPTPTDTPTPTEIPPVEWDLDPYIEKTIEQEWEGVMINARLLVDSSLEDQIESIDIPDELFAEVVARNVWIVWYARQGNTDWYKVMPVKVHSFMKMWAKAQETGDYSDWRKVQLNDIWANDLTDGDGYVQEPYNFWPMYEGETPDGVTAVKRITLVLLRTPSTENISLCLTCSPSIELGRGSNFNNGDLLIYSGVTYHPSTCLFPDCSKPYIVGAFSDFSFWLVQNNGGPFSFDITSDAHTYNKLLYGGLKVDFKFE